MSLLAVKLLLVAGMAGALVLVPIGVPGLWIMAALLLGAVLAGWVSWLVWTLLTALVALSEVIELLIVRTLGARYGGSSRAFWGAVGGGFVGVVVGMPVAVVGSVLAGLVGTFVGAFTVTLLETRSVSRSARVGWGVVLARTLAVGMKVGAGVVLLVAGGIAMAL